MSVVGTRNKTSTNKVLCTACDKRVYKLEELRVDGHILHKECFKCQHCKRKLALSSFAAVASKLYCKTHYMELFRESGGSYEVFGDAGFKQQGSGAVQRKSSFSENLAKKANAPKASIATTTASKPSKTKNSQGAAESSTTGLSLQERLSKYKKTTRTQEEAPKPKASLRSHQLEQVSQATQTGNSDSGTSDAQVEEVKLLKAEIEQLKNGKKQLEEELADVQSNEGIEALNKEIAQLKDENKQLQADLEAEREKVRASNEWCKAFKEEIERLDLSAPSPTTA